MQKSILSLNWLTKKEAINLGNVMAIPYDETKAKQSLSVEHIIGKGPNPLAGILDEPLINFSMSANLMSLHLAQSIMQSNQIKMMASSFVWLLDPLSEY